jgi:methionine-rich copper-binding protein CopC
MFKRIIIPLIAVVATLAGFALGHSNLKFSNPKDHALLMTAPKNIVLEFDEAIETKISNFKVYYFKSETMMKGDKPMTGAQMDDFAEAAAKKFMALKTDTADRMDTGLINTKAQTNKITIGLKTTLKPGVYVIAWKTTSVDTHVETGFIHFHLAGHSMPGMK